MKKVCICLTIIISCYTLHAQQIEPPSFRDYLNNKNQLIKAKPRVLITPNTRNKFQPNIKDISAVTVFPGAIFAEVLPNTNKLYILPQDNMVCIVPDMKQFNMPVIPGDNSLDKKINGSEFPMPIVP